jgi:hypothetical protein
MPYESIAIVASCLALIISLIALWCNSLRPFSLKVSHDAPTFTLYKITPSESGSENGKTWWIPSFNLSISFHNAGRIAGEILDMRINAKLEGHRLIKKYAFYPKWVVDYSVFQKYRTDRFTWASSAVKRDWYPIVLPAQQSESIHVIMEGERWDEKQSGRMTYCLQIISSRKKKWIEYGQYSLPIFDEMFEEKSSYSTYDTRIEEIRKL